MVGVIYAGTNVFEVAKATGVIETGMGFGVSSSKIEEIFNYKNTIPVKKTSSQPRTFFDNLNNWAIAEEINAPLTHKLMSH